MFWSFIMIYVYCEMGQNVTDQLDNHEYELGQSNWYLFPIELQRIHSIVLAIAQHPTTINGYGNIVCSREAMKLVIRCQQQI